MTPLFINFNIDYCDEATLPVISLLSEKLRDELLLNIDATFPNGHNVGFETNREYEFSVDQIREILNSAKPINSENIKFVKQEKLSHIGVSMIDSITDYVWCYLDDNSLDSKGFGEISDESNAI